MATEDIYGNKRKYLYSISHFDDLVKPPTERIKKTGGRDFYVCKNPENLKYFKKICNYFEVNDLSYIRRSRILLSLRIISHVADKDLRDLKRDEINEIVAFMHSRHPSPHSKSDFILHIKLIWKNLFSELDEMGRPDERTVPYVVRHLRNKIDKSIEVKNWDPLSKEEFERVIAYFDHLPSVQCFLVLAYDALIRPQELCWRKIKDINVFDDRVEVIIRDHGKEGVRTSWSFKALPYVLSWLRKHPDKDNPEAYFFQRKNKVFKPMNVNKMLKFALKELGINKRMTTYKLNHQGITDQFANPAIIQKKRGWAGLDQLRIYDHSTYNQGVVLERSLRKGEGEFIICPVCSGRNMKTSLSCENCKRRLDGKVDVKEGKAVDYLEVFLKRPEIKEQFEAVIKELMAKQIG